ncbi:MAG: hypothetical protein COU25_00130 [Candidatus Levybacteria bacterium CG10_big_fil_rev_8_21_14_0_10_35_13]|nr:MAG: hypothetical protein COU25_00130 [Candidatus Levybacteria bacterium CG10_big_fil_rev_8_21_14_0_10_35_13]
MKERLVSPIKSGFEYVAGKILWEATRTVRFEVDDPNGNFVEAAEALDNNYSILAYSNHISRFDPALVVRFADRYLTPVRNISGIAGLKHYDSARTESSTNVRNATRLVQKYTGLGVILVVQDYDKASYPEPSVATNNKSAAEFNASAFLRAARILRTPGKVLFVAPEGTRSKTGELAKAEEGLDTLFRLSGERTLAMPIAIVPPEKDGIKPLLSKVKLRPGEPMSLEDLNLLKTLNPGVSGTDLMMRHLASLLSQHLRGFYR